MNEVTPEQGYKIAMERIEKAARTRAMELDLRDLNLTTVPVEIGQLVKLTSLDLSNNRLTSLPEEIGRLVNLTSFDLYNNQLTILLKEISQLVNLTFLDIRNNQLTTLPEGIGQLISLTYAYFSNNWLTSISSEIGQLSNLTWLDIESNQLPTLPVEIGQLINLVSLNVSRNHLIKLPVEIGKLVKLTSLNLSSNKLTTLPRELGQLVKLTSLDIHGNQLITIPAEIGQLDNLTVLNIAANHLTTLPVEIGQLVKLTLLNVAVNQLTILPEKIGQMNNLTSLSLSRNRITTLPASFQRLKNLENLALSQNPLPIPPEILEKKMKEPQAILNYYFVLRLKKALNECKVLVVGQGSVGKTSLVQRLLIDKFDPNESKTQGIAIKLWKIENGQSKTISEQPIQPIINLHIWDFGGQEIMHATHQFFLTKRSLYLLVLDSRLTQEENRIEYWLKMIQSFGSDSPVLVVGNKTDQHPFDIDRRGLQKKYPNIVAIFDVSAATGEGMSGLRSAIVEQIYNLSHVRDELPESWFMIKKRLEELGRSKNFINYDEFLSLCSDYEVTKESDQRMLIVLLHDLGVVLHFQDDPRLEALGILNPQWVTNGVYMILNSNALFQRKGALSINMLNEILDFPEYPHDKRIFIVDMMKKFELCYDIVDNIFLVPNLLPKDEPFTGEWDGALAFQYHYTVLPSSVITRFIVRMNEFIHKTVWRSGVVLKSGDNTALVKADMEDKKIYIWVNGAQNTRRDFLSAIRNQFDAIHKTITKLEVREKVPIPGQVSVVVDFEHLMKLERKNIDAFIPEGMDDEVSVRQLLSGVARESDRQRDYITVNIHGNVQDSTIAVGDGNQLKSNRSPKMDIPAIAFSVSSALAPYFPYIIKGVKLAGQKWFESLGEKAGEETVKQATKTWESIKSKAPENKTIVGAAMMLSDDPANVSVRKMFSDALAEVLKAHPELLQELTEFQKNAPSITLDQRSGGVYFEGSGNVNIKGDVVGRDQTKGK